MTINKTPSWLFTIIILCLAPLSGIGIDLYTPSLPAIATHFHSTASLSKATVVVYLLGFALGQVFFGFLSDSLGRKKLLLLALTLYGLMPFLCIFSPSISLILILRFFQGVGGSGASVLGKTLMTDSTTDPVELKRLSTYYVTAWALGPIVAPFFGGLLQHYFGWQASFGLFALIGLFDLLLCLFFLNETLKTTLPLKVKVLFSSLLFFIRNKEYIGHVLSNGIIYSLIAGFSVFTPFIIQEQLGYSAIVNGNMALIAGIGYFIGTNLSHVINKHIAVKTATILALILSCLTALVTLILGLFGILNLTLFIIPIFIILVLLAGFSPTHLSGALSIDKTKAGAGSALFGSTVSSTAMIATFVISIVHFHSLIGVGVFYLVLVIAYFLFHLLLRKHSATFQ